MSDPSERPRPRTSGAEPADSRAAAVSLVEGVLRRGQTLDRTLERQAGCDSLAPRDRAFARRIAATTLKRLGQIDALIAHCLDRPLPAKAAKAVDGLRIGAAQLVFMDTPAHAAVDRTVELIQGPLVAPYRRLVNAVLRRLAAEGEGLARAQDAARLNTPDWLWRSWTDAYGEAACRAIAAHHLAEAALDITVKGDAAEWAPRLEAEMLPTGTLRRTAGGAVTELPGFDAGAWWVQDAAAALPARLAMTALGALGGATVEHCRIADLCAAPGGKTAQLAAAGAAVTAVDRSPERLARLRRNLARLGLAARLVEADAALWQPGERFDAVLLDAPCTGTGTIRRHPDIARLKAPADIARQVALQDRLLAAAAALVAPGGVLVYGVCSLQPEEGADRIAAFLAARPEFERAPVAAAEIAGIAEALTPAGDLTTRPDQLAEYGGWDGFYAARLRRR